MHARTLLLAIPAAALLAGCASTGTATTAAAPAPSKPSAGTAAPAPSSTPTPQCSTYACVARVMEQDSVGMVAANDSVVTAAKCKPSTVKHNPGDTWTARCTITYSDDSKGYGLVTLLPDQGKIAFQPDGT